MLCSLDIVDTLSDSPIGTKEVAEKLISKGFKCSYITAWRRLHMLHDANRIEGKKTHTYKGSEWQWYMKKT